MSGKHCIVLPGEGNEFQLSIKDTDIEKSYVPSGIIRSLSYIRYSPAGRSVLGETVPKVLTTARGEAVLRPRAQFLPIQT